VSYISKKVNHYFYVPSANIRIFFLDMDEIQHYLMEPLISHINEVNENSEEEILSAENDELANDDVNIYSDPSDP
jgi:hypothetical protein